MATTTFTIPFHAEQEVRLAAVTALPATGATSRLLHVLFRATVLIIAISFFLTGFILLDSPLALPFAVSMWIGAAATMALGIRADLSAERTAAPVTR